MDECMAELYGKKTGCSKGKGGSMHFFAPDKNFWGGHGIVGGQTPLGLGIAYALKFNKKTGACLCFMGDGATNQGPFYESLNLASLWNLPVVYVIENNGYSMGTSEARHSAGEPLARRATSFDIDWSVSHGHDVYEVRHTINEALELAHKESRPSVLEITTYRYRGHSVADPDQTYRSKEEIEEYKKSKDPINLFKDKLISEGHLNEERAIEIDTRAKEEADASADFAQASPLPEPDELMDDVSWETDNPSEKTSGGLCFSKPCNCNFSLSKMATITYREALNQALRKRLSDDHRPHGRRLPNSRVRTRFRKACWKNSDPTELLTRR